MADHRPIPAPDAAVDTQTAERPARGILLVIAAMLVFSSMDGISKSLSVDYDAFLIAWIRYASQTVTLLPLFVLPALSGRPGRFPFGVRHPWFQVMRGLGMFGSAVFFIVGLRWLPIAEATAIGFASPLLLIALSTPLLGEQVGPRRWAAVLVGFIGVLVVVRPGSAAFQPAALYPLLSAVCWALALVASRRIGADDPPLTTLMGTVLTGLAATSLVVPAVWQTPTWAGLGIMILGGLLSTVGQYLLILGFMAASASLLAPFQYSQMLTATLIGWLVFDSLPDPWVWLGAGLIVASGLYAWHRERLRSRSSKPLIAVAPG